MKRSISINVRICSTFECRVRSEKRRRWRKKLRKNRNKIVRSCGNTPKINKSMSISTPWLSTFESKVKTRAVEAEGRERKIANAWCLHVGTVEIFHFYSSDVLVVVFLPLQFHRHVCAASRRPVSDCTAKFCSKAILSLNSHSLLSSFLQLVMHFPGFKVVKYTINAWPKEWAKTKWTKQTIVVKWARRRTQHLSSTQWMYCKLEIVFKAAFGSL